MARSSTVSIGFDMRIYKPQSIAQAMKEFADFAKFSSVKKNKSIWVSAANLPSSQKTKIIGEFSNYALALTKKCL